MATENRTEFDAIVIGTGPGGATVAKELSAANQKVLILERGGDSPVDSSLAKQLRVMRVNFIDKVIPVLKGITTGGSSMLFCGCAFDPPLDMFRSYGIDLAAEVEEVKKELPIGPLADPLIGPRAKRIMASALELGYDWKKLNKFVYQDRCESGVPYQARWNARLYVREAQRSGALLETRARVRKVLIEKNRAVGVEFTQRGSQRTAYANEIIVAAGGIGSPVILRASGIQRAGEGSFCDPLFFANGTVGDTMGPTEEPMAAGIHMENDGYMMTDLTWPWYMYQAFTAAGLRFDRLFAHSRTCTIMVKAKDSIGGRITDRGGMSRTFPQQDINKLNHGYERAKTILRRAGAKNIFRSGYLAAHPGGTVRVNDVLDANLKTEYDGLYACDCSVIPEAWGLPPTLTLLALGKRLGKHLIGQ
jgi:choline dehydrogenase-like flavoprotein